MGIREIITNAKNNLKMRAKNKTKRGTNKMRTNENDEKTRMNEKVESLEFQQACQRARENGHVPVRPSYRRDAEIESAMCKDCGQIGGYDHVAGQSWGWDRICTGPKG